MEFKSLLNIESNFRQLRLYSLVFAGICTVITLIAVWKSYSFAEAQRQKIFLYSSIPDEQVRPMGMRSFSDMTELLKEAKLDGKSIYVIPNGATVVPHVC